MSSENYRPASSGLMKRNPTPVADRQGKLWVWLTALTPSRQKDTKQADSRPFTLNQQNSKSKLNLSLTEKNTPEWSLASNRSDSAIYRRVLGILEHLPPTFFWLVSSYPHLHDYSLEIFIHFLGSVSSNLLFCLAFCLLFVLLCDDVLVVPGMPSESELSVTTHNDEFKVGAESNTKICCANCVGGGCFVSYWAYAKNCSTIDFPIYVNMYAFGSFCPFMSRQW